MDRFERPTGFELEIMTELAFKAHQTAYELAASIRNIRRTRPIFDWLPDVLVNWMCTPGPWKLSVTLARLESKKWVASKRHVGSEQPRWEYALTDLGRKELDLDRARAHEQYKQAKRGRVF